MKNNTKLCFALCIVALLLLSVFLAGCVRLSASNTNPSAAPDSSAKFDGLGVYVKPNRDDIRSVSLYCGNITKVCENADNSPLEVGEWLFMGDDLAGLSADANSSVLFTVSARGADNTLLEEGTFLYSAARGKLYVTISPDGINCSTSDAADAPANVTPVPALPILDELDATVTIATSGSSLLAIQAAAKLLDWGTSTELCTDEISAATSA